MMEQNTISKERQSTDEISLISKSYLLNLNEINRRQFLSLESLIFLLKKKKPRNVKREFNLTTCSQICKVFKHQI